MRGADRQTDQLFSYVSPESLVPPDHPLRAIRVLVNAALERLSPAFAGIYADGGRPSIAPEKLLRALLLQVLFSIRSERQLMQQLNYNMLFRWFVGLAMDTPVWDVTVFTKNRDRLLDGDIACGFLAALLADPRVPPLLSSEHFSVDGTLIEAWASSPHMSGGLSREQGISRAGNPRARTALVEAAWLWLRHQPGSALARWFVQRVGEQRGRVRRIMIVALARKLLIALWRYIETGLVPKGATLRA